MVKIITDTSALYTVEEGKKLGIHVIPLCIDVAGQHLRDLSCDTKAFLKEVKKGGIPTSSQPPIGEVINAYESFQGEEIINICMADGLSGTYQTALSAKEQALNGKDVTVLNSTTLCGPHRYLVQKANALAKQGKSLQEILSACQHSIEDIHSFLIPQDFAFLKRGGRLKPAAATIGGILKLKPVMQAVDGGSRLDKYSISRTMGKAVDSVCAFLKEHNISADHKIYVAHADALQDAEDIMKKLRINFSKCEIELLELSPAFITQGGPDCIAIQTIRK